MQYKMAILAMFGGVNSVSVRSTVGHRIYMIRKLREALDLGLRDADKLTRLGIDRHRIRFMPPSGISRPAHLQAHQDGPDYSYT